MVNDRNIFDDLELSGDYGEEDSFSLESILAEYKGSAFMDGDRPTPSDELQRKTDDILREVLSRKGASAPKAGTAAPRPVRERVEDAGERQPQYDFWQDTGDEGDLGETRKFTPVSQAPEERVYQRREPVEEPQKGRAGRRRRRGNTDRPPEAEVRPPERFVVETHGSEPAYDTTPEIDQSVFEEPEKHDSVEDFYEKLRREPFIRETTDGAGQYAGGDTGRFESEVDEIQRLGQEEYDEDERRERRGIFGVFRRKDDDDTEEPEGGYWDDDLGPEYIDDEDFYVDAPDPDFKKQASVFAARVPSLRFRMLGVAILCVVMFFVTHAALRGTPGLFGLGDDPRSAVAALTIMELAAAALGLDVMIRGFEDILGCSAGTESLVFISCAMSVLDGISMLLRGTYTGTATMALVSCVSLLGAMSARKTYYMAMCDSLRAAKASSSTYGVTADFESVEARHILKKITGASQGFYTKLTGRDVSERLYDRMAPVLVIASFVLASLMCVVKGRAGDFAHSFSVMTAVCAAFPAAAVFALPFKYAASAAKKAGGAVAGFAGARDIYYSDGALITDQDIFPTGSVTLSGLKIFEGVSQEKVIVDTASMIITSDSGLRKVFEELLKSQGLLRRRTDDFACYDGGGIGGLVEGERVLVGTGAFMNLMGIRVPESVNGANSVFTAINGELAGVFSLNYVPSNSVQTALVALLNTRTNLLMAVRDFNVTPNTVKQKFKVSMDGVEYLPIETTYDLSQNVLEEGSGVSAILCRGGLAPFAEVITRGRLLKLITELNTALCAVGTVLGLVMMFFLCWAGSFASASAENIFIFMSVIGLAVYIMSQTVRRRLK